MNMNQKCPPITHFHVSCTHVEDMQSFTLLVEKDSPEEALKEVLGQIGTGWVGSIEISDDQTNGPSDMPLIDYWKD